jgi:hypothetical protein
MTRLTLALAVWISLVGVAAASLAPLKQSREEIWQARAADLLAKAAKPSGALVSRQPFQVTEQTEVLLDGRPCRYAEVPSTAVIIKMEVAEDKTTVLKVHFRTRK